MANNTNRMNTPSNDKIGIQSPRLIPSNGEQLKGSMPNLTMDGNQLTKQGLLNNNPNGYSPSPVSATSLHSSASVLQSPAINNIYNHHSSSQSSRNSSPAMNQSLHTQPSPLNLYKTPVPSQPGNPLPPTSASNVTRPLLQPSFINPANTQTPGMRPLGTFPQPQPMMFPNNANKIPGVSQSNASVQLNNNQFAPVQSTMTTHPLLNRQINSSAPSLLPSQNINPPNSIQQAVPHLPPSASSNLMNMPPRINQTNQVISQPGLPSYTPQGNQLPPQGNQRPPQGNQLPPKGNQLPPQGNQLPPQGNQLPLQGNQLPPQGNRLPPPPQQQFGKLPPVQNLSYQNLPPSNLGQQINRQGAPPPVLQPQMNWNKPAQPVQNMGGQYYNNGQSEQLSNQMGKLSVTQNSFSQLWGHETIDLLQCRNVLTEDKEPPPTIKLANHFSESVNCSPDIFRCTLSKIPESNNLLQKSRLPLGVLIHPFKDLNHLPVIQCNSIVRCRSCRTYINPFVYFVDLKRWKCNLCYRVNDLPEEFQYDPVSKTYGEPRRRPEIQSATLEYVAPSEYMLRPPQPASYCFVLDVSSEAARSGYLSLFCKTLAQHISEIPGDSRTMLSFICFDHAVHFYSLRSGKPNQMTVMDIDDIFVPSPEDLLVNLAEKKCVIEELLEALPGLHANPSPSATQSALGSALTAAHKLMSPIGGRITVFQTCLPNIGPGALTAREDPNNRSSKEVAHLNPAIDFYKRLALECSGVQVAVDLFLLNSQYADLSTLNGVCQFSGGTVYHFPLFKGDRENQAQDFERCLTRYLTRKIGFEAVMRVRCTRGISIHTFHGSFFVRSTDLLALPNVSPDAGFGMQLSIEESLADVQQVCFQAALLYTSSKGERRIRVHTMCLPVVNTLSDVIHGADQQAIIGLLCKMGVDRSLSSSLTDAREALLNAVVDALGTQKLSSGLSSSLVSPMALRLMPLYMSALLKHPAFRIGTSTRLDDRIAAMCMMKTMPLNNLMRCIYPDLYPIHDLMQHVSQPSSESDSVAPCPPRYHLSAERVNANGAYLMDQETLIIIYIGHRVDLEWLQNAFGVSHPSLIPPEGWFSLPVLETEENAMIHAFISQLNDDKPYAASLRIMVDTSPNRALFIDKLLDDRVESALSYHEFLQHVKSQIK